MVLVIGEDISTIVSFKCAHEKTRTSTEFPPLTPQLGYIQFIKVSNSLKRLLFSVLVCFFFNFETVINH